VVKVSDVVAVAVRVSAVVTSVVHVKVGDVVKQWGN